MKINEFGRSMVEMLGVLAIIGVLSVGAIAGYSVAMRKYKLNKLINEQTYLINGLIQHDSLRDLSPAPNGSQVFIADYVKKLELIPSNIQVKSIFSPVEFNLISVMMYLRNQIYVLDYRLATSENSFDSNICTELMSNLIIPLSTNIRSVALYRGNNHGFGGTFYGDTYCSEEENNCIKSLQKNKIYELCTICEEKDDCYLALNF